jgi:hypothetical protein
MKAIKPHKTDTTIWNKKLRASAPLYRDENGWLVVRVGPGEYRRWKDDTETVARLRYDEAVIQCAKGNGFAMPCRARSSGRCA